MSEPMKISPSEWEIMEILWKESPLSAAGVIDRIADRSWSPKTVRTFLARLLRKGCLKLDEASSIQSFLPAVERAEVLRQASRSFLEQFFDGTLTSMIAHFIEDESSNPEEIAKLRRLLDERRSPE